MASTSLDLGCVRLTERFLHSDPPTAAELDACRAHVRDAAPDRAGADAGDRRRRHGHHPRRPLLGLAEEDPALVHGHTMTTDWIETRTEELSALTVSQLRDVPGMHPDRAPVIVAGAVVVTEALRQFGLAELAVSECDLMHGAALAAAELPAPAEGPAPPGAYTCC